MDCVEQERSVGGPSKAPIGYQNVTSPDGKKIIVPKQPEANHIKWSFEQIATGYYSISKLNKIACLNGLNCKRNNFWQPMYNPIYCGFITLSATKDEEKQLIEGIHEPLISKELFYKVQELIASRRRLLGKFKDVKSIYPLRGFLTCPYCNRKLSASTSQARHAKYRYYLTVRTKLLKDRISILNELEKQTTFMLKVWKQFIEDKIDHDDFISLKREHKEKQDALHAKLLETDERIRNNEFNSTTGQDYLKSDILFSYKHQDVIGKGHLVSFFVQLR